MPWKSYRAESRKDYGCEMEDGATLEQTNTGALLRIADATELMAKNWNDLVRERDFAKMSSDNAWRLADELKRRNAELRIRLSHFEAITTGSEHKTIDAALDAARKEKSDG